MAQHLQGLELEAIWDSSTEPPLRLLIRDCEICVLVTLWIRGKPGNTFRLLVICSMVHYSCRQVTEYELELKCTYYMWVKKQTPACWHFNQQLVKTAILFGNGTFTKVMWFKWGHHAGSNSRRSVLIERLYRMQISKCTQEEVSMRDADMGLGNSTGDQ